jgi:beta-lactamase class A
VLTEAIAELEASADVRWGVSTALGDGPAVDGPGVADELATASVGKVVLLIALAWEIETGRIDSDEPLTRAPDDAVADSGLWQHLRADTLPVADLATLVGTVSDNLATNVLLRRIGLERVAEVGRELGLQRTGLRDKVRDHRGPADPPELSTGSAAELRALFARLMCDELHDAAVSGRVRSWLANSLDLSMVAGAFGFDPLAHQALDRGYAVVNKTGTNGHVRADVGWVQGPTGAATYAVIANWREGDPRDAVLAGMRRFGLVLRNALAGD